MSDLPESHRTIEGEGRRIVGADLQKQAARCALARERDNQFHQGATRPATPTIRPYGDGQQLGLVGRDAPERKADLLSAALEHETGDPGRGKELGHLPPRPAALSQWRERLGVKGGSEVEIERSQRPVRVGSSQSTVRRWPSGSVTLTPRR